LRTVCVPKSNNIFTAIASVGPPQIFCLAMPTIATIMHSALRHASPSMFIANVDYYCFISDKIQCFGAEVYTESSKIELLSSCLGCFVTYSITTETKKDAE